jgi:hypothetical protein
MQLRDNDLDALSDPSPEFVEFLRNIEANPVPDDDLPAWKKFLFEELPAAEYASKVWDA